MVSKISLVSFVFLMSVMSSFSQCFVTNTSGNPAVAGSFPNCLASGQNVTFAASFPLGGVVNHAASPTSNWATVAGNITIDGNGRNPVLDGSFLNDGANTWKTHVLTIGHSNVTVKGITFRNAPNNNTFGGSGLIIADAWGTPNSATNNVTIEDCLFTGCTGPGMQVSAWTTNMHTNITVKNCEAHSNATNGIHFYNTDGFLVDGGTFHENRETGIQIHAGSLNGVIKNAEAFKNGLASTGNTNSNAGAGIRVFDGFGTSRSHKVDILNTKVYDNNIHGIECAKNSDDINIISSEIYNNGKLGNGAQGTGVAFQFGECDDNTVVDCDIYDNADAGIYMYKINGNADHTGNVFYQNRIYDNGGGISILASSSSYIIENEIKNSVVAKNNVAGGGDGIFLGIGSSNVIIYNNEVTAGTGNGIVISDDGLLGVTSSGSNDVTVLNNYVGVTKAKVAAANSAVGVLVQRSDRSNIGVNPGIAPLSRALVNYGVINATFTTLRNYISSNGSDGVRVLEGKGNKISNNYIGLNVDGNAAMANGGDGINITKTTDIEIGVDGRNLISANAGDGIELVDLATSTTAAIENNYIGLDVTGQIDFGNGANGILLQDCRTIDIESNVISGNAFDGIKIGGSNAADAAESIKMIKNYIGLAQDGTKEVANDKNGINVDNGNYVYIGDSTFLGKNVVSGNSVDGILINGKAKNVRVLYNFIGLDVTGKLDKGNSGIGINMFRADTNYLKNNYVGFSGSHGVSITDADTKNNLVQSNVIGVAYDVSGTPNGNAANNGDGIHMEDCIDNLIGGSNNGARLGNVIGYNTAHGINVSVRSRANQVYGNYIGINIDNTNVGNTLNGIVLDGTSAGNNIGQDWRTVVGGANATNAETGNYISFNTQNGILIKSNATIGGTATYNTLKGNTIGLNLLRDTQTANGNDGIRIDGGNYNTIGGDRQNGAMNFIAGKHKYQIHLLNGASNNRVYGNSIGNNSHPGLAATNTKPTSFLADNNSVFVTGANTQANLIGGFNLTALNVPKLIFGNVIAQDNSPAAVVIDNGAHDNYVSSNFIGMSEDGKTPFGSLEVAISVINSSNSNVIGGLNRGNLIGSTVQGMNAVVGGNDAIRILDSDDNTVSHNMIGVEFDKSSSVPGGINGSGVKVSNADNTKVNNNIVGNVQNQNNAIDVFNSQSSEITYNQVGVGLDSTTVLPNTLNGIYVNESNNSVVKYNYVTNSAKHGVVDTNSTQTTLTHNESFKNAHNGIYVSLAQISQLDSNIAYENSHNGILIDNASNNTKTNKNSVKNNTLNGIRVTASTGVTMTSDTAMSNTLNGFRVDKISNGITINTAISEENKINGVHISESTGGTVSNSLVLKNGDAGVGHGILIDTNSHNYTTTNNSVKENVQNGIYIIGCTDGTISGDSTVSNGLNGVRVHQKSTPVTIENGVALTNNKHGIWVTDTENATIDGNRALSNGVGADKGSGILVDTNSHNVIINANTAQQNTLHGIHVYSLNGASITANDSVYNNDINGIYVDSIMIGNNPTNTVSNNKTIKNKSTGIVIRKSNKTNLMSNEAKENVMNGIHVFKSEEARLVTNETFLNGTGPNKGSGILVDTNSHQVFTDNNHSHDNTLHGIHILSINDAELTNDRVLTNGGQGLFVDSVKVVSGTDIKITNVAATSNQKNGVLVRYTAKANMTNSTLSSNQENGVKVDSLSNDLVITNNTATSNVSKGIHVSNLTTASITTNNVDDNEDGIYVSKISGVTITGNQVGVTTGNKENGIRIDTLIGVSTDVVVNTNQVNQNILNGIYVLGNNGITSFTGNIIGMDAAKTSVSGLGNGEAGVKIHRSNSAITITDNFIGGNKNGIHLRNASRHIITNNKIGTQTLAPAAIDLGNTEFGILMDSISSDNTVNNGNVIAHNNVAVSVDGTQDSTVHNRIVSNSMFCNDAGDLGGIILSNNGNKNFLKPDISTLSLGVFDDEPNGGADYLVLAPSDSVFFKELHGLDIHVYEHDATCDNCRQGQTLLTTLQVDTTQVGYGVSFDLGSTAAVDNATTADECSKYTFTVTDAQGNTSEFSTCSKCLEPVCTKVVSEFVGISRDTTVCGNTSDIILTVKDDPALATADEIIKWYLDTTGTFGEVTSNLNQKTFTVKESTKDSVRVVYTYQEKDQPTCAVTDTVTIHYVKAPKMIVSDDFKLCESVVTAAGNRINIDPTSKNNVTGDSLDYQVWTHNGAGKFDNDSTVTDPFYLVNSTDIGNTVTFNFRAVNSVRYPRVGLALDSTICFTIDSTYEVEFVKEAEIEAGDNVDVCGGTPLDLGGLVNQAFSDTTSIIWTTSGIGTLSDSTSAAKASYVADTSEYKPNSTTIKFKLEGKSSDGCPSDFDSVNVTFLNSPTLVLDPVSPVCEGNAANVSINSVSGHDPNSIAWGIVVPTGSGTLSGSGNSRNYTPDMADYGDTVSVFVRVKSLTAAVGSKCEFVSDTAEVIVNIQPTIEVGDNMDLCVGTTDSSNVTPVNNIKGTTNSVVTGWTTAMTNSPANNVVYKSDSSKFYYTATAADANKTFTVTATTNSNGACLAATDNMQITVHPLPTPDFTGTIGAVCGKGEFEYDVTSFSATSTYTWKAVTPVSSNVTVDASGQPQTTKLTYKNPSGASYNVKVRLLEQDANSCVDSVEKTVTVEETKNYTVDIIEGTACEGSDVTFSSTVTPSTGIGNLTYKWERYDVQNNTRSTISSGTGVTSSFNSKDSVLLVVTSDYKCLDTNQVKDTVTVKLKAVPDVTLDQDAVICAGSDVVLTSTETKGLSSVTYIWSAPEAIANNDKTPRVSTAGQYKVIADHLGCKDTSNTITITVKQAGITATISKSVIFEGEEVVVTGIGTNGTSASDYTWSWLPTNNVVSQFKDAPTVSTTYTAEADLTGTNSCKATASVFVKVIKPLETFNVFTPHEDSGDSDGINDVWVVQNIEFYDEVSIKVYNRWGSIVYEYDGNGQSYFDEPWDGNRNGKPVPMAVYYYIVKGKVLDIEQKIQGHVSIVR